MGVSVAYYRNRTVSDAEMYIWETIDDPSTTVFTIAELSEESEEDFSNEGYLFIAWNTARDGSGTSYAPGDTISSNTTLYAVWRLPNTYTVKENQLIDIADAIREKTGGTAGLSFPDGFISGINDAASRYAVENLIVPYSAKMPTDNGSYSFITKSTGYNYFNNFYVSDGVQKTMSVYFIPMFDIEVWFNSNESTKYTLEAGKQYMYTIHGYMNNNYQSMYETLIYLNSPYTKICDSGNFTWFIDCRINFKKKVS